jgi:protein SCO1/2
MMKASAVKGILITLIAVSAIAAGIWLGSGGRGKSALPIVEDTVITVLPKAKPLQPFRLQTGAGKEFDLDNLKGKYTLLFFGYTSCPDICPTTMYEMKKLYAMLEKDKLQNSYQVVFVSVDPRRDTLRRLEEYVAYFNKSFIGATGADEQIATLAKQLGASYEIEDNGKSKDYSVSHTGVIFVINPGAKFAAILSPPHQASRIESRLVLLAQVENQGGNK